MQRCVLAAAVLFFSELAWPPASAQKTPSLAKHIAPVDISLALRERVDLREFDLEYDDPSTEVQAKGIPVRDRGSVRATTGVRYPAMPHAVASDSPLQPTSYFARLREEFLSTPCDGPGRCLPHVMGGGTEHSGSKTIETTGSTGHKRHKRKKILLDPRLASVQTELKVAFLFLTRGPMPLERLWMRFFDDAKEKNQGHLYSVYLHAAPGYQYNESTTPCVDFWHREIPHSRSVEWGMMSVVDAERSLLLHALAEDALNQWFVLLSESCIPLRSLDSIREHLLASPVSFVDSFNDVQGRYHPSMAPVVQKRHWRKGGQWFAMCRRHALMVVEDTEVYAEFNKWCQVDWNEDHSHWRYVDQIVLDSKAGIDARGVTVCVPRLVASSAQVMSITSKHCCIERRKGHSLSVTP